ncbi:glycosyltransferase family 2 protein [Synechococcus sp. M16CYN]|uniref:glycosyltransferase family 2 protein n=1 Tax=Synechococcus sp. M16CYN TaxID=3103139 RepID=UPI00324F1A92
MSFALLRCAAVVACRNEADLLKRHLPVWISEGLELVVIDHSSSDETQAVANAYLNHGVLAVSTMKWLGYFSLDQQLAAKAAVIESLDHDWVVHLDTDEWLHSPHSGETLQQAISRLAATGANAVNFEEFVFLPLISGQPAEHYYFFESTSQRLHRAWARCSRFNNQSNGGHQLNDIGNTPLRLAKESLILRHYIARNQYQVQQKYLQRHFSPEELHKGWHKNRLQLSARQLTFPDASELEQLAMPKQRKLERSTSHKKHYWHWPDATKTRPCRSIVCLYCCAADTALLNDFYSSSLWKLIRQRADTLLLEVWGGGKTVDHCDGRRLILATPEAYDQLCYKTLRMLRWCIRRLRFKQLIKIDLTCVNYRGRQAIEPKAVVTWLEGRLTEPLREPTHYDGFLHHIAPVQDDIHLWGRNKGVSVEPERVFGIGGNVPSFYSGKAYALSRSLMRYIAGYGAPVAREHARFLCGAEDLMVGRMAKRFQVTQSARRT